MKQLLVHRRVAVKKLLFGVIAQLITIACLAQAETVAIKDVAIVDMTNGKIKKDQTALIEGNRIVSVSGKMNVPQTALVIDGKGKYLIPGLWDMHVHSTSEYAWVFPLFIANGVTGIREMGTRISFDELKQLRQGVEDGKIIGPHICAATQRIFGDQGAGSRSSSPNQTGTLSLRINTPEEGRTWVRKFKKQGMDFIKVHNQLSREAYLAIIDEAKKQKIPVEGHVPFSMTAMEVSDLGQLTIEHNTDIMVSCSSDEAKFREETTKLPLSTPLGTRYQITSKASAAFDDKKATVLFKRFVHNGTWLCPTIVFFLDGMSEETLDDAVNDERLKYIPARIQDGWKNQVKLRLGFANPADRKVNQKERLHATGLMYRLGVKLLAGSDTHNPYDFPGFSIHEELELLVQCGLSPLAALQTATINPAKFLHKEKDFSSIEKGKYADMILLDANPLEHISNTRKIAAVIMNGKVFQRADLDQLLSGAENIVKTTSK